MSIKKASLFIGIVLWVAYCIVGLLLQVLNIDMTDMRLLVTYWKFYLSGLIPVALMLYGASGEGY